MEPSKKQRADYLLSQIEYDHRMQLIGRRVKNLRLRKGFSLTALSELAEVRELHISNIERGVAALTNPVMDKLAAALGVTSEYLQRPMMLGFLDDVRTD